MNVSKIYEMGGSYIAKYHISSFIYHVLYCFLQTGGTREMVRIDDIRDRQFIARKIGSTTAMPQLENWN